MYKSLALRDLIFHVAAAEMIFFFFLFPIYCFICLLKREELDQLELEKAHLEVTVN